MLRQLTSSELSELIAYSELHPVSPGLERMLAQLTCVVARCAGNAQFTEKDFHIRKAEAEAETSDPLADLFRIRARNS